MKKVLAILLALCLCSGLVSCTNVQEDKSDEQTPEQYIEVEDIYMNIPESWVLSKELSSYTRTFYEKTFDSAMSRRVGIYRASFVTESMTTGLLRTLLDEFVDKKNMTEKSEDMYFHSEKIDDIVYKNISVEVEGESYPYDGTVFAVYTGETDDTGKSHRVYIIAFIGKTSDIRDTAQTCMETLGSKRIDSLEAADTTVEGQDDPAEDSKPSVDIATRGELNALESAKLYLSVSSFSYSGLIEQLEYEGYTSEEATYAVDNCGADWNEQAVKSAQSYLSIMSFSRQGLIDQLVYEGFTQAQAEHGVSVAY